MRVVDANKKNGSEIELLVIKSFPKKKIQVIHETHECFMAHPHQRTPKTAHGLKPNKSTPGYDGKAAIITLNFIDTKRMRNGEIKAKHKRLATSQT